MIMTRITNGILAIAALLAGLAAGCTTEPVNDDTSSSNCGEPYSTVVAVYSTQIVALQDGSLTCEEICEQNNASSDAGCSWSFDEPTGGSATHGGGSGDATVGGATDSGDSTGGAGSTGGDTTTDTGSVAYVSCVHSNECVD